MFSRPAILLSLAREWEWFLYNVAKPKGKKSEQDPNQRSIAQNRKASHNYLVLETLECGIALVGSEVKSLRDGKVSMEEAYARVKDYEVWLMGCDIAEYTQANQFNHLPKRPRKLLLHRREIKRFASQAFQKGLTLVPLKMYFKEGRAKVLLGLCKGKQKHDKRQAMRTGRSPTRHAAANIPQAIKSDLDSIFHQFLFSNPSVLRLERFNF